MHFSGYAWDVLERIKKDSPEDKLRGVYSADPIVLKILTDGLKGNKVWKVFEGKKISKTFLEEQYSAYDLFEEENNILVLDGENIEKDFFSYFNDYIEGGADKVFLYSSSKLEKNKKKFQEVPGAFYESKTNPFWKNRDFLNFFLDEKEIDLSPKVKEYVLDKVPFDSVSYYNLVNTLWIRLPDVLEATTDDIDDILNTRSMDVFQLADIFSRKSWLQFFSELQPLLGQYESLRSLFSFLQSHLLKIADPSYLEQKKTKTRYDEKIQRAASLWKFQEIEAWMQKLGDWEIEAKSKNSRLNLSLKAAYLKFLKV